MGNVFTNSPWPGLKTVDSNTSERICEEDRPRLASPNVIDPTELLGHDISFPLML